MSEMVRKQIYIHKRHEIYLQRLAQVRGVSQAEIIRQAIEHEAAGRAPFSPTPDRKAWEEVLAFAANRVSDGRPYIWNREDAYEERENRYDQPVP